MSLLLFTLAWYLIAGNQPQLNTSGRIRAEPHGKDGLERIEPDQ